MKRYKMIKLLCGFLTLLSTDLIAQIPLKQHTQSNSSDLSLRASIDTSVYRVWPEVGMRSNISNDGKYVFYTVENVPLGNHTFVIKSIFKNRETDFVGASDIEFTADSRYAIVKMADTSMLIVRLATFERESIKNVVNFSCSKSIDNGRLAYMIKKNRNCELRLRNIKSGKEEIIGNVIDYLFSEDGSKLLFTTLDSNGLSECQRLECFDLNKKKVNKIAETVDSQSRFTDFIFDKELTQIAFTIVDDSSGVIRKSIGYYKDGFEESIVLFRDSAIASSDNIHIADLGPGFNDSGDYLIFRLNVDVSLKRIEENEKVHIWSYADRELKPEQLRRDNSLKSHLAAIYIPQRIFIPIETGNESFVQNAGDVFFSSDFAVDEYAGEKNWIPGTRYKLYVRTYNKGKIEREKSLDASWGELSPRGKYLVYYDTLVLGYKSYNIQTGVIKDVTKGINTSWKSHYQNDYPNNNYNIRGIAGWLDNDDQVLIYDEYDIWKIDLSDQNYKPVNLTGGYGKANKTTFHCPEKLCKDKFYKSTNELILTAFNVFNKNNGFYKVSFARIGRPELLTMGPFVFEIADNPYISNGVNYSPIKAKNAQAFLVRRMSASESPNYFYTAEFKTFIALSDIHPERSYNWQKAELHSWKGLDGNDLQGILYLPSNFNPKKKYPVIFNYYEIKSDGLNVFVKPDNVSNGCNINIPTFISNDYLVFLPDINFKIGETGESIMNSVISAARYVSAFPFVDSTKMGIQGCSLGGYATNYIITHSNLFVASCAASSISDYISHYGSITIGGNSLQGIYEKGQNRMGVSLWERPDLYIRNSPVFNLDKVVTPLLIMHTRNDGTCPFSQAIELYTGLRRLGKKVWMVEYEDCNHGVWGKTALDFNLRLSQFFDYYLKGKPIPIWMIQRL